jgi:hypothetical protein
MGFLKKLKFWKKKKNSNTPTKVEDACVSTEDPRTCHAATMTMDPTVLCAACTQTETRMDCGGGAAAAAKGEYERELEVKNQNIQEREEELAVSRRSTVDMMLNVNSVGQQVRKWAEEPVIFWSDDCDCKQKVSADADLLKKLSSRVGMPRNRSQKPPLAGTPKLTVKHKQKQTAGRGIVPLVMSKKL